MQSSWFAMWLLHQPLFRGKYSKSVSFAAILKLFTINVNRAVELHLLLLICFDVTSVEP